jgi:hypothetical protein
MADEVKATVKLPPKKTTFEYANYANVLLHLHLEDGEVRMVQFSRVRQNDSLSLPRYQTADEDEQAALRKNPNVVEL